MVDSSQAYDNKLLSKLGKPRSPPDSARSSVDAASPNSRISFYQSGRHPLPLKSLSVSEGSKGQIPESPFKRNSPFSAYGESPRSRAISPNMVSSATSTKSYMDFRSPTMSSDNGVPPSAIGPYPPQQRHYSSPTISRHHQSHVSGSESVFSNWDESAESLRKSEHASGPIIPKRGSEDQSTLSEADSCAGDFPMEEPGTSNTTATSALRHLHLDDHTPPTAFDPVSTANYYPSPFSPPDSRVAGMNKKRGASSPPPEASRGDKVPLHSVGGTTNSSHLTSNNRQSPINHYPQPHGSFSSASSIGLRNGSYASSTGLSIGASSITSMSSHERLSPRGLSPSSEYQQSIQTPQYPPPPQSPLNPSPRESFPRTHQRTSSDSKSAAAIARKMSSDTSAQRKGSAPSLQAHVHMCTCCPKKPKKFDTIDELR